MNDYLNKLLDRVRQPISDENPCGENVRFDDRYDRAKTEIMKLTAGASVIDWKGMRLAVDALLSEKTKDLTLAAYLSLALLKEYEYPGLLVGFQIVDSFLDTWWEPMFPPAGRMKARVQIFEWMDERLSALVGTMSPKAEHAEALRQCKVICDALPEKVRALTKMQVTGFSQLRTEINQAVDKLPPVAVQKEEVRQAAEEPQTKDETRETKPSTELSEPPIVGPSKNTAVRGPTAPAVKIELPPSVENLENLDEGIKAMIKIVHLLRKADPLSPIVYRLARVLKWELVQDAPPATADGKTKIPSPSQQILTILETQRKAGNWVDLTETAEHMFIDQGGVFIDLQKYVCEGLTNQGAEEAATAVRLETGRLVSRLPVILDLKYATGLPFANDETRSWALEAVKAVVGSASSGEEDDDGNWLKNATKVAAASMASALPLLHDAISRAENTKKVMIRQRDVARFFISNREYKWALPLLESLNEKIEAVSLAQWDPDFCSDVWSLILSGYMAQPSAVETTGKDDSHVLKIRQKLFETNVAKAAASTPSDKKK